MSHNTRPGEIYVITGIFQRSCSLSQGDLCEYWDVPGVMQLVPGTSAKLMGCSRTYIACPGVIAETTGMFQSDVPCPRDMHVITGMIPQSYYLAQGHLRNCQDVPAIMPVYSGMSTIPLGCRSTRIACHRDIYGTARMF